MDRRIRRRRQVDFRPVGTGLAAPFAVGVDVVGVGSAAVVSVQVRIGVEASNAGAEVVFNQAVGKFGGRVGQIDARVVVVADVSVVGDGVVVHNHHPGRAIDQMDSLAGGGWRVGYLGVGDADARVVGVDASATIVKNTT